MLQEKEILGEVRRGIDSSFFIHEVAINITRSLAVAVKHWKVQQTTLKIGFREGVVLLTQKNSAYGNLKRKIMTNW